MSALGQKRTFAVQNAMSALPPKADIAGKFCNARERLLKRQARQWMTTHATTKSKAAGAFQSAVGAVVNYAPASPPIRSSASSRRAHSSRSARGPVPPSRSILRI